MRRARLALGLALAALPACGGGAAGSGSPAGGARAHSLAVVVLDALPASAVGAWGYERPVTPELDALAARGVRFAEAYSGAAYTLAAVSSLFTGLTPRGHGVVGLDSNVLAAEHETLAEALARAGFATAGFSSNPHVTAEGGFDQGFAVFRHYERGRLDAHSAPRQLLQDAAAWWGEHAGERRFLYAHVLPPHQPYDPPEPWSKLFGAADTDRKYGLTEWLVDADKRGLVRPGSPEARAVRARYDAGLAHADAFLGALLRALDERDPAERPAVCVVSDHGEAFGEHGRLLHGSTVFAEMVHVPLVLAWPGVEPAVAGELVSTIDLPATLCELLDAPFAHGVSFLGLAERGRDGRPLAPPPARPAVSRTVGNQPVWALRTPDWTLLEQSSANRRMLFDRRADPGEAADLLSTEDKDAAKRARATAAQLAKELAQHLARDGKAARARASDATHRAAVDALGYAELEAQGLGPSDGR